MKTETKEQYKNKKYKKYENITVLIADDNPDKQGDCFDINGIDDKNLNNTVPIFDKFQMEHMIGIAKLKKVGNKIKANIEIEEGFENLFPGIVGKILKKEDNIIKEFSILCIGICESGNTDPRIENLKCQNNNKDKK